LIGGPPVRICAEITGAVAVFKKWNPAIMVWAAILAMALAFVGKLSAIIAYPHNLVRKPPCFILPGDSRQPSVFQPI
jgi:hypothetical protein